MAIRCSLPHFDPATIARSGQCFRMTAIRPDVYRVIAGADQVTVRTLRNGQYSFSCTEAAYRSRWRSYFDLDGDYQAAIERIPPKDAFLLAAVEAGDGLRLLRQDPWEMLVSFIISQRKSIPAIRGCIEKLCALCGKRLRGGLYAFPTAHAMAKLSDEALRSCGVGYRAPYLHAAACRLDGSDELQRMADLSDAALLDALCSFPGVGVKVASCVMLFGYHRLSAAPVDVWINRVIDSQYGGVSPFPTWGEDAGLYQQYLFYYQQQVLNERRPPAGRGFTPATDQGQCP